MIFANSPTGARITATPGATATCPGCGSPVVAKCGQIITWHWAHDTGADCDTWSEPVGEWHLSWQNLAPSEFREVVMGQHRADLRSPSGYIVELQHSSLPIADIRAREAFYGRHMVWIWDAREAFASGRLQVRTKPGKDYVTFRWKHPRKSLAACERRVYLDLGNGLLLRLAKMHPASPCGGWGYLEPVGKSQAWIQSWALAVSA